MSKWTGGLKRLFYFVEKSSRRIVILLNIQLKHFTLEGMYGRKCVEYLITGFFGIKMSQAEIVLLRDPLFQSPTCSSSEFDGAFRVKTVHVFSKTSKHENSLLLLLILTLYKIKK